MPARERNGKEKLLSRNLCVFFLCRVTHFVALSSYSVHVSLKMELEIKFSKSRSKFSLNNDNFCGNCCRLVFYITLFFGTKIDVNSHYNEKNRALYRSNGIKKRA